MACGLDGPDGRLRGQMRRRTVRRLGHDRSPPSETADIAGFAEHAGPASRGPYARALSARPLSRRTGL
ncbi:hypothetical protein SJA_C1-04310 [Sphingobium indicum UT26S]|uniref:Uncharacterized protein n=1 Tax=Sphingobium indicum (strain DSM 16413 / CCM 7287 / MTCC 6362 / UT26 / NBRC 101211 / UT26S) TaxID=452662 RepID=D4YY33_SPHIU|nr:hypothetical protein SJA_C1-04310 [Sphingobium indicum UT26S]